MTDKKIVYTKINGKKIMQTLADLHEKFDSLDKMINALISSKFVIVQAIDSDDDRDVMESHLGIFAMPDCDCPNCQNLEKVVIDSILDNEGPEQIEAKIALMNCIIETMQ